MYVCMYVCVYMYIYIYIFVYLLICREWTSDHSGRFFWGIHAVTSGQIDRFTRRHQMCHFRKLLPRLQKDLRTGSTSRDIVNSPLQALQAQKSHVHGSRTFGATCLMGPAVGPRLSKKARPSPAHLPSLSLSLSLSFSLSISQLCDVFLLEIPTSGSPVQVQCSETYRLHKTNKQHNIHCSHTLMWSHIADSLCYLLGQLTRTARGAGSRPRKVGAMPASPQKKAPSEKTILDKVNHEQENKTCTSNEIAQTVAYIRSIRSHLGSRESDSRFEAMPSGAPAPWLRRLGGDRQGTNGVSTTGVTAQFMFFDRDFWVLHLAYFYLPRSARAYLFPRSVKIHYFCSGPISVDPICPQPRRIPPPPRDAAVPFYPICQNCLLLQRPY